MSLVGKNMCLVGKIMCLVVFQNTDFMFGTVVLQESEYPFRGLMNLKREASMRMPLFVYILTPGVPPFGGREC